MVHFHLRNSNFMTLEPLIDWIETTEKEQYYCLYEKTFFSFLRTLSSKKHYQPVNLLHKNSKNSSCMSPFLTNSPNSFYISRVVEAGLSDAHKLIITVMKSFLPKRSPNIVSHL